MRYQLQKNQKQHRFQRKHKTTMWGKKKRNRLNYHTWDQPTYTLDEEPFHKKKFKVQELTYLDMYNAFI
jgi:hypothetical protein